MSYKEAIAKLAGYDKQAKEDERIGILYMRELYLMARSAVAQTFGKTEDEVQEAVMLC